MRDRWPVKASWQSAERELNRKKFGRGEQTFLQCVTTSLVAPVEESEAGQSDTATQSRARGKGRRREGGPIERDRPRPKIARRSSIVASCPPTIE